jgi:radical SAM protein with 4Fe4S-binding SPASM domain
VLRNIGRLVEARRSGPGPPEIHLVAVAMRGNLHELPDLVRLVRELGIAAISVQHLCHDFGEDALPARYKPMRAFVDRETLLAEDPARVAYFFDAARSVAADLGVELRLPNLGPREVPRRPGCDWPRRGAYISYAGDAMPCCMVATPDRINFGNMATAGVAEVWNNDRYRDFRRRLESDTPPDICRSCAVYNGTF